MVCYVNMFGLLYIYLLTVVDYSFMAYTCTLTWQISFCNLVENIFGSHSACVSNVSMEPSQMNYKLTKLSCETLTHNHTRSQPANLFILCEFFIINIIHFFRNRLVLQWKKLSSMNKRSGLLRHWLHPRTNCITVHLTIHYDHKQIAILTQTKTFSLHLRQLHHKWQQVF